MDHSPHHDLQEKRGVSAVALIQHPLLPGGKIVDIFNIVAIHADQNIYVLLRQTCSNKILRLLFGFPGVIPVRKSLF